MAKRPIKSVTKDSNQDIHQFQITAGKEKYRRFL
jgi:hypothetical protein